ncbi:MAG: aldo/keto reductase [Spirochaetales bacterium]|nr:aldo/keto reductase [Spirochaetales bacterium]
MQNVRLGKTNLQVTKIGFGGIPIQRHTPQKAEDVVFHALQAGMNWCDTANAYGHSEEVIGRVLRRIPRNSVYIFTKGHAETAEMMRSIVETSFSRLGINYIDLYQIHNVRNQEDWEMMLKNGVLDYLLELKAQGRIGHIGASAHTKEGAFAALSSGHIEVFQWPFNIIVAEDSMDILDLCRKQDIGFIAMKPLGGGMITNGPLCVRFLSRFDEVAADPGFETVEEIDELFQEAESAADVFYRNSQKSSDESMIRSIQAELGKLFCRRCEYCSPCAQGVRIVLLMTMKSMIKRFPPEKLFKTWLPPIIASHDQCTECGECEKKCPYELPIISEMKNNVQLWQTAKAEWESA